MSIASMSALIGQTAEVSFTNGIGSILVQVRILDAKQSYGKERYQIEPVAGSGKIWVESFRLQNAKETV